MIVAAMAAREGGRREALALVAVAGLTAAATLLPNLPAVIAWALAPLLVVTIIAPRYLRGADHHIRHRIAHRLGELTLIMIGEALLKVGLVASDATFGGVDVAVLVGVFAMTAVVVLTYFGGVLPWPRSWLPSLTGHALLHLALIGLAVGLGKFLLDRHAGLAQFVLVPALAVLIGLVAVRQATPKERA